MTHLTVTTVRVKASVAGVPDGLSLSDDPKPAVASSMEPEDTAGDALGAPQDLFQQAGVPCELCAEGVLGCRAQT